MTLTMTEVDESTYGTQWLLDDIIEYPDNAKVHNDDQVAKIAASIREFGWTTRIVVDSEGVIIQGHGRKLAAASLGMTHAPITQRNDLSPEQVKALRLVDNRVALGRIDDALMKKELEELMGGDIGFSLEDFFAEEELNFVLDDIDIDLDALTHDLAGEVDAQGEKTSNKLDEEDGKLVPLREVFSFSQVTVGDQRAIKQFMAHCEAETGETGATALSRYAKEWIGV